LESLFPQAGDSRDGALELAARVIAQLRKNECLPEVEIDWRCGLIRGSTRIYLKCGPLRPWFLWGSCHENHTFRNDHLGAGWNRIAGTVCRGGIDDAWGVGNDDFRESVMAWD
jgi:hypothetical protein